MEIKDVKCLVRSGYSINGSDCPELAFIFCQLRHGLVQAAGARAMRTERSLCHAWRSSPGQVSPSLGHGLRRASETWDAVARCWLLSNTLFLLAWPSPPQEGRLLLSSSCLLWPLPTSEPTAEGR